MQAAPITSAATVPGTGADANAAAGGDLFAALMAALFNPAQAAQAALTPTGDPAKDGGGQPDAGQAGANAPVLPIDPDGPMPGGPFHLSRARDASGEFLGARWVKGTQSPLILPGEEAAPAAAPAAPAPPSKQVSRETAPAAPPPSALAAQPAAGAVDIPADLLARSELVALKGQAMQAPAAETAAAPAAPAASTLIAAQAHASAPQPLIGQVKVKAANLEAAPDKAGPARPAGAQGPLTAAQLATQGPAGALAAPELADLTDATEADFDPSGQDAGAGGEAPTLHADAAHAPPPAIVRGSPQTVAHLSAEIARRLEAQSTRFQVELEPAGMGKVEVNIEIGASGALTAALNCDNAHAAEALRARSGELQAALEQAGFDVRGGLSFTTGDAGQGQAERHARDARAEHRIALADLDEPAPVAAPPPPRVGPGRLDIRI